MRDYGSVQTSFWTSPDIQKLSSEGKLLALYFLTCTHSNALGCFRLPIGYIEDDLCWERDIVKQTIRELEETDFVLYDHETKWLLMPKFLKWNQIQNVNVGKHIEKLFRTVPEESSIYKRLADSIAECISNTPERFQDGFVTIILTVSDGSAIPEPDPQPQPDHEQDQQPPPEDGGDFFNMNGLFTLCCKNLGFNAGQGMTDGTREALAPLTSIERSIVENGFTVASQNGAKSIAYVKKVIDSSLQAPAAKGGTKHGTSGTDHFPVGNGTTDYAAGF